MMRRALLSVALLLACSFASASTLYVTEFKQGSPVTYQAALAPANVEQTVTFTTSSVQSAAFSYPTALIRVVCDADCHVKIGGTNPTATASTMPLKAGIPEYFQVAVGDKIAVIGS